MGIHPYVEVESSSSKEHEILTVCAAHDTKAKAPSLTVSRSGTTWTIGISGEKKQTLSLSTNTAIPVVQLSTGSKPRR
jgi:D-tyrosyl-tRNA(Tyr) deacylase